MEVITAPGSQAVQDTNDARFLASDRQNASQTSRLRTWRVKRSVHLRNGKRPPCLEFKAADDLSLDIWRMLADKSRLRLESDSLDRSGLAMSAAASQHAGFQNGSQRECASGSTASTMINILFLQVKDMEIEKVIRKR
jgi:hypothetical protein